jgi:hypothetical protein
MTSITSIPQPPGRVWGVLALVAAIIPLPFLLTLNVLSIVVRSQAAAPGTTAESIFYGLLAIGGLFFFPLFSVLAIVFAVRAVTRPRLLGRVLGWVAIAIVVLSIPLLWTGYLVWIMGAR